MIFCSLFYFFSLDSSNQKGQVYKKFCPFVRNNFNIFKIPFEGPVGGQFGTGPNLAPIILGGQFGTKRAKESIWHRTQFGKSIKESIWHRDQFGTIQYENLTKKRDENPQKSEKSTRKSSFLLTFS